MGIIISTQQEYYSEQFDNYFGNYQFVTLEHVINGFMVAYVGEGKVINKVNRTDVQFHAMRGAQELAYDVSHAHKAIEVEVPNSLQVILPQDYVNYTRISRVGDDGIERPLYPTKDTSHPIAYVQDANGDYVFTDGDNADTEDSTTWENFSTQNFADVTDDTWEADDIYIDTFGRRYGLDPSRAQSNGSYFIDQRLGKIHFGSNLVGKTVVLRYISDGLGTTAEQVIHKFCEEALYKWIAYGILSTKSNVPEYVVKRYKQERTAAIRNSKIRLSDLNPQEFTQIFRGKGKIIK